MLDLDTGEHDVLQVPFAGAVAYSTTGHLLYPEGRFVMAQAVHPETLDTVGSPSVIAEVGTGPVSFAYGGGTLVYGGLAPRRERPVIMDRSGAITELPDLPEGVYVDGVVSPDGSRLAFAYTAPSTSSYDLWVYPLPEGPLVQVTEEGGIGSPAWLDDDNLAYVREGDIWRIRADGNGGPRLIVDRDRPVIRVTVGPQGDRAYFDEGPPLDVGVVTPGVEGSDSLILRAQEHNEGVPAISPDGRQLAYASNESGRYEVYLRPLEGTSQPQRISQSGGSTPEWSSSGSELLFATAGPGGARTLMAAELEPGNEPSVVRIRPLFDFYGFYDAFPDGRTFLAAIRESEGESARSRVTVVRNLDAVLGRRDR